MAQEGKSNEDTISKSWYEWSMYHIPTKGTMAVSSWSTRKAVTWETGACMNCVVQGLKNLGTLLKIGCLSKALWSICFLFSGAGVCGVGCLLKSIRGAELWIHAYERRVCGFGNAARRLIGNMEKKWRRCSWNEEASDKPAVTWMKFGLWRRWVIEILGKCLCYYL